MPEVPNTNENTIKNEGNETSGANVLIYPTVNSTASQSVIDQPAENASEEVQGSEEKEELPVQPESKDAATETNAEAAEKITSDELEEEDLFEEEDTSDKKDRAFRNFFHFHSKRKTELSRDELILSRISDDDLMEYLRLEQQRLELMQRSRDIREKRIATAFQLTIFLLAIVLIVYFLKDNPTILVSMLYTVGILLALYIWNRPQDKDKNTKKYSLKKHPFSSDHIFRQNECFFYAGLFCSRPSLCNSSVNAFYRLIQYRNCNYHKYSIDHSCRNGCH